MHLNLIRKGGLPFSFAILIALGTALLLIPGVCLKELSLTDAFSPHAVRFVSMV